MKILLLSLALIAVIQLTQSATLRRKPKVYNALITTDQNLTPSRAFPVIQSHLQETYSYPPYSYRNYAPLGVYNNGFQYGTPPASSIASYNRFPAYPRLNPGLVEGRNYFPRDDIHSTLPPIPLNYGLPPALIPINSFGFKNLAPYPYNSYPLIYDQFAGYGGGYLPPYQFYPAESDGTNSVDKEVNKDGQNKDDDGTKEIKNPTGVNVDIDPTIEINAPNGVGSDEDISSTTSSSRKNSKSGNTKKAEHPQQQSLIENIKNFPNKNPSIPDVPPPPPVRNNPVGTKAINK